MLYLIDASALLNQPFEFERDNNYVITQMILKELKTIEAKELVDNALVYSLLKIENPKEKTIKEIETLIRKKGFTKLSKADVSLLALAKEYKRKRKKFAVITDDYSIQNFLFYLKIPFYSAIQGRIIQFLRFEFMCEGCRKKFKKFKKECDFCGNRIKRMAVFR